MPHKSLFITLLVAIIFLPSMVFSAPPNPKLWEPLRNDFYYNIKIIIKSPDIRLVWTYGIITDEARMQKMEDLKKYDPEKSAKYQRFHHETFLWEIDCKNRQMRMEEFIDFDQDAHVLDRYRYRDNVWTPIPIRTGGDALYQKVCFPSKKPLKKSKRIRSRSNAPR